MKTTTQAKTIRTLKAEIERFHGQKLADVRGDALASRLQKWAAIHAVRKLLTGDEASAFHAALRASCGL